MKMMGIELTIQAEIGWNSKKQLCEKNLLTQWSQVMELSSRGTKIQSSERILFPTSSIEHLPCAKDGAIVSIQSSAFLWSKTFAVRYPNVLRIVMIFFWKQKRVSNLMYHELKDVLNWSLLSDLGDGSTLMAVTSAVNFYVRHLIFAKTSSEACACLS